MELAAGCEDAWAVGIEDAGTVALAAGTEEAAWLTPTSLPFSQSGCLGAC